MFWIDRIKSALGRLLLDRLRRNLAASLGQLDDCMLADLGIHRGQIGSYADLSTVWQTPSHRRDGGAAKTPDRLIRLSQKRGVLLRRSRPKQLLNEG